LDILNSIRENNVDDGVLKTLNNQHAKETDDNADNGIVLCTRKAAAEYRNKTMLENITSKEIIYNAAISGVFEKEEWKNAYPAAKTLALKKGARVMMLVNDKDGKWVNGTIGVIGKLSDDEIVVEINNIPYTINRHVWEAIDYIYDREQDELLKKVTGTFTQFLLMLAWAITIHKSQGKTFDKVMIDLGKRPAFAHGQTYVALSRCKTLSGIKLVREVERKDIIVDDEVVRFIKEIAGNKSGAAGGEGPEQA
jgi:hypothetical protein